MPLFLCIILSMFTYGGLTLKPYPKVSFPRGSLIGKYMTTRGGRVIQAFLSIPFAKPPVGDLRFQPPQPADLVIGEMLAQTQPHPCTQASYTEADSEDCLYLNVFTPNVNSIRPLPVYFFIFGGNYLMNAAENYKPEYLLDEDVVLVVIQYRLGLFGFLSTGDVVVPGNMGYKDVRCGLRWVRDNIMRFGGDKKRVTIVGNSAGASTVHMFMIYVAHEGLFRAGISESGSALQTYTFVPPLEIAWIVDSIANITNCPVDSVGLAKCLRAKSAKEIIDIYNDLVQVDPDPFKAFTYFPPEVGPVMEPACVKDRIVTDSPWHHNTSLPYLTGVNSKELLAEMNTRIDGSTPPNYTLFDSVFNVGFPSALKYQFSSADGSQVPFSFRNFYLANKPFSMYNLASAVDGLSDAYIIYCSFEAALRSTSLKTFFYFFDYIGVSTDTPLPMEETIGAAHGDEVYYFFPSPPPLHRQPTEADIQLSKKLVKMWVNFVTYLNPTPNYVQGVKWSPFHPYQSYLHIKQHGFQVEKGFFPERMNFWKSQPYPFRDDVYGNLPCSPSVYTDDLL